MGATGAQGSAGAQGVAGTPGNANVVQFSFASGTILPADTTAPTFVGSSPQLFLLNVDKTTLDKSALAVYAKFSGNDAWQALPLTAFAGTNVLAYTVAASVDGQGKVFVQLSRASSSAHPLTTTFTAVRVLLVPANVLNTGRSTLDWGRYEEVRAVFGLAK